MNFYSGYNNPYYNPPMQTQMGRMPPMDNQFNQYNQPQNNNPMYKQNLGLQGKSVDSLDVVKAMDIPLDGSISYFPLTDGSAIVTKQLQADGTSRTIVYKPIDEVANKLPKYITMEELDDVIKKVDNTPLKEDIKVLKRQIKDLNDALNEIQSGKDE